MPERRRVSSGSPYEDSVGFSRAVRVGDRVVVSGTAPIWPDGSCPEDAETQARRCLEIIGDALREAGSSLDHVVRTRMFITDAAHADAVGRAHRDAFGETAGSAVGGGDRSRSGGSVSVPLVQVDAFAEGPFTGNPAAVCLLETERDAEWMQRVGAEMNLSETAFLVGGDGTYSLRWFTPAVEVDLCGHATLASAHALWEEFGERSDRLRFETRSGRLTCSRNAELIEMDFPAWPLESVDLPAPVRDALGVEPVNVMKGGMGYVVELADEAAVRRARPDFGALGAIPDAWTCITARGTDHDFVSRYFAPQAGIDEDPVTGSAHCALSPYWAARLGRDELVGYQASARGGVVRTTLRGDRVLLGGRAVTVLRGQLVARARRDIPER